VLSEAKTEIFFPVAELMPVTAFGKRKNLYLRHHVLRTQGKQRNGKIQSKQLPCFGLSITTYMVITALF